MKTILETTQLEFDKSDFLIDLVKHENGQLYVEILQTFLYSKESSVSIKINPSVLPDILKVLQKYEDKIPKKSNLKLKHISEFDQERIQNYYLKGVSLKDLALQFDQTLEIIQMVLTNRNIKIVENKIPKYRKKNWRKGRTR